MQAEQFVKLLTKVSAESEQPKRQKPKRKPPNSMPSWRSWLAGLGAASTAGAYGIASDQHAADLQGVLDRWATAKTENGVDPVPQANLLPNETGFTRYHNLTSKAIASRPFGLDPAVALTELRKRPDLVAMAGADPSYASTSKGTDLNNISHYRQFDRGPIQAYSHQLDVTGTPVGPDNTPYSAYMRPHFQAAWRKFLDKELPGTDSWITPNDIDQRSVPHEKQLQFMQEFHAGLPDDVRKIKTDIENTPGSARVSQMGNYLRPTQAFVQARDTLKSTGMIAGGAAAGGFLGHYLHRAFAGPPPKRGPQESWSHRLATVGGAGLGGLAGYAAGMDAQGRNAFTDNLVKPAMGAINTNVVTPLLNLAGQKPK